MPIERDQKFLEQLERHEGFCPATYFCPSGALTIGYGHNLDANPIPDIDKNSVITKDRAERILIEDCRKFAEKLDTYLPWWRSLNLPRQGVLLNMAFNMGVSGLLSFKNTLRAVREGRFKDAGEGMLASKWATQVKGRAKELAAQMRTGEWQE